MDICLYSLFLWGRYGGHDIKALYGACMVYRYNGGKIGVSYIIAYKR